jgi:hypothetical protein
MSINAEPETEHSERSKYVSENTVQAIETMVCATGVFVSKITENLNIIVAHLLFIPMQISSE